MDKQNFKKIPISYGMNGPWSAILRGAYKKEKQQKLQCYICFQSFVNNGNLQNHMKHKHKFHIEEEEKRNCLQFKQNPCE